MKSLNGLTPWAHCMGNTCMEHKFIAEVLAAPAGSRAVLLEVGANNGGWTAGWAAAAKAAAQVGVHLEQHFFEPQPVYFESLIAIAASLNATFVPAAAGSRDGHASFHVTRNGSMSSSLDPHAAVNSNSNQRGFNVNVPTIDLAKYIRDTLPQEGSLSFIKLDVEGYEYELLPWLLMQDALCRLSYINVEWHLNRHSIEKRLAGLGLRLTLNSLLAHGCTTPPKLIYNEEYEPNNQAIPVPGLHDITLRHSRWGDVKTNPWTMGLIRQDLKSTDPLSNPTHCTQPRCAGSCAPERLACNRTIAGASYKRGLEHPVSVRDQLPRTGWFGGWISGGRDDEG